MVHSIEAKLADLETLKDLDELSTEFGLNVTRAVIECLTMATEEQIDA